MSLIVILLLGKSSSTECPMSLLVLCLQTPRSSLELLTNPGRYHLARNGHSGGRAKAFRPVSVCLQVI
jgi:hypothetical protein